MTKEQLKRYKKYLLNMQKYQLVELLMQVEFEKSALQDELIKERIKNKEL